MYLNDANAELIQLYEVIRQEPQKLMVALDNLAEKYSEDFYYELRSSVPDGTLEQAARTLFLNKTGFNGLYRQNAKGEFNVPFGKRKTCPALYDRDNLLRVSQALQPVTLMSFDFEHVIDLAQEGDCVYCDPPYDPISKTSSFHAYQGGGFSREDQKRLKEACLRAQQRGAFVLISNSSSAFIQELYSDCQVHVLSARRSINAKGDGRGCIKEALVILSHANRRRSV